MEEKENGREEGAQEPEVAGQDGGQEPEAGGQGAASDGTTAPETSAEESPIPEPAETPGPESAEAEAVLAAEPATTTEVPGPWPPAPGPQPAAPGPEPAAPEPEPVASGPQPDPETADQTLRAVLEAIVYIAEEPLTLAQIAAALQQPQERVRALIDQLIAEFDRPEHGVTIREVAGGFKMATKAEHHDAVRSFVKSLKPPLKLSLPALETLAVIAYKQPVTAPEISEIRGVQGTGVLKTLLDRKLIAVAGRKNVIGKPILYKTTKEFLIQFGLKDLSELPSLKEFEEIRRMAMSDAEPPPAPPVEEPAAPPPPAEAQADGAAEEA